nr:hypothetical protein [Tanacetum cinerariifolium]
FFNYALILRQDYDITSSLRRGALHCDSYLTQVTGPEASESLPQKKKKPQSKKTPKETKATPPLKPTEGSEQSHSFSLVTVPDLQHQRETYKSLVLDCLPHSMRALINHNLFLRAFLLFEDELAQKSDEEEVLAARDDMEEDTQADEKEDQQLIKYLRKVSRVLFIRITKEQWAQHKEVVVSYAHLKASVEGYYEETNDHKEQTDKLVQATMDSFNKTATDIVNLLKAFNRVTKTLKAIQDAVKEDPAMIRRFLKPLKLLLRSLRISLSFSPLEHVAMDDDKAEEEPTRQVTLIESSSKPPLTDPILDIPIPQREGRGIATEEQLKSAKKLVLASDVVREKPNEPIRIPYMINGKIQNLTDDELNAYLEKEVRIKKAAKEAKTLEMTKTK